MIQQSPHSDNFKEQMHGSLLNETRNPSTGLEALEERAILLTISWPHAV